MKCVDCGVRISREQGHLCSECYQFRLKDKIMNEDRVVESPHASWF